VQEALFDIAEAPRPPVPVVMSLNPEYYDLIWADLKTHEFRRRYLEGQASTWYVYLTAPVSRLCAVVDLDAAVVDSPSAVAAIAEEARPGNGASVFEYLADKEHGFAIPIRSVREYTGFTGTELEAMLGSFHPPQGYIRIADRPEWSAVCDKLTSQPVEREKTLPAAG
jgi:predicted transcriptional regulator